MGDDMIRYHGGPITPETCAERVWRGRHAFISWAHPEQLELAVSISQSVSLDNGAFSFWKSGTPIDWDDYYRWSGHWLRHPAVDWAVIPDVIEGSEDENDVLVADWPHGDRGVPVWHLNESIDRLVRLAERWPRIALGSAADYDVSSPTKCIARLREALLPICDDGVPRVKLHGLRMLNPAITSVIPLASGDSTNVARNIGIDCRWGGSYVPATKETRAQVLVERMDRQETPARLDCYAQITPAIGRRNGMRASPDVTASQHPALAGRRGRSQHDRIRNGLNPHPPTSSGADFGPDSPHPRNGSSGVGE